MLNVIFTLDYEIHGNGDGCPHALMVEPTSRLLDLFEKHGAKLTIMADVAEILKFREYRDRFGRDDFYYNGIESQLKDGIRRGHDVQLHLHCSYFNSRFEGGKWIQDWSEYNFAKLSEQRLNEVIRIGKGYLEEQLQPIDSNYCCNVFRAANWAVSPSRNIVRSLVSNGFQIETSVFKYGRRKGIVSFDYSHAPSNLVPWPANENDICKRDEKSRLLEVPIYAEQRWIGAFLTPQRIHRAWLSRQHRVAAASNNEETGYSAKAEKGRLIRLIKVATRHHAWKADFNQCSGNQLIRALERAETAHRSGDEPLPFVLIGHSKLFSRYNERCLEPFLRHVARNSDRFKFGKFRNLAPLLSQGGAGLYPVAVMR
jgi:hypothetical protein